MKKTNNTVSARKHARLIEATIKVISRKLSRMNEAQYLRAMQLIANMDDRPCCKFSGVKEDKE